MFITNILGIVIFAISFLVLLFLFVGAICKNFGVSTFNVGTVIFMMFFAVMCFAFEHMILDESPQVSGVAVFFVMLNALLLPTLYFLTVGAVILGKKHIYRVNHFLILKKHPYDDIIGYTIKKTGGTVQGKFGSKRVEMYDVEIHFKGNHLAAFSTSKNSDRKIVYFKEVMTLHNCHRNGRIRKASRKWF